MIFHFKNDSCLTTLELPGKWKSQKPWKSRFLTLQSTGDERIELFPQGAVTPDLWGYTAFVYWLLLITIFYTQTTMERRQLSRSLYKSSRYEVPKYLICLHRIINGVEFPITLRIIQLLQEFFFIIKPKDRYMIST